MKIFQSDLNIRRISPVNLLGLLIQKVGVRKLSKETRQPAKNLNRWNKLDIPEKQVKFTKRLYELRKKYSLPYYERFSVRYLRDNFTVKSFSKSINPKHETKARKYDNKKHFRMFASMWVKFNSKNGGSSGYIIKGMPFGGRGRRYDNTKHDIFRNINGTVKALDSIEYFYFTVIALSVYDLTKTKKGETKSGYNFKRKKGRTLKGAKVRPVNVRRKNKHK